MVRGRMTRESERAILLRVASGSRGLANMNFGIEEEGEEEPYFSIMHE
jgi:hypothetical protein